MTIDNNYERLTCRDFIRRLQTKKNIDFCLYDDSGEKYAVKNTVIGKSRATIIAKENSASISAFAIDEECYANNIISLFSKKHWQLITVVPHVEFVSYTGKYPHLCNGILTLKIDGEEYRFGNEFGKNENYPKFWHTGGSCSNHYIEHDDWIIDPNALPKEIRCYADTIAEIFNENIEQGCCGGCL